MSVEAGRVTVLSKTGRPCLACSHPQRQEIDKALLSFSATAVSTRFGISARSLNNHKREHLPMAVVESSEAIKAEMRREWWGELRSMVARAVFLANDDTAERSDVVAAVNAAAKLLATKGKALGELQDVTNIWLTAGYPNQEAAEADKEMRESIKSMTKTEIHACNMEFERRYALEAPEAAADYRTLLEISGGGGTDGTDTEREAAPARQG